MKPARFAKTRKISLIVLPACALLALVAWSPTSPDTRVVVGTGNTLNSSTKAMIAGDNNTTNNPSSKVLIVGQENTHCGSNNLLVGIGPNFSEATHRTINSFTNFGAGATDLPVKHRGDGTETDVMPCINGQIPWPVGEELDRLLEIERLIDLEGWAYLIVDEANVKGDVTNYPLPHIQGRWKYETAHALSAGDSLLKQGTGVTAYHFVKTETLSKRIVISAPGDDVPALRYKSFFTTPAAVVLTSSGIFNMVNLSGTIEI